MKKPSIDNIMLIVVVAALFIWFGSIVFVKVKADRESKPDPCSNPQQSEALYSSTFDTVTVRTRFPDGYIQHEYKFRLKLPE